MLRRLLRPAVGIAIVVVGITTAVLGGSASTAWAHAGLVSSTPFANSVLEAAPPEIVLEFDESIEVGLTSIALYDGATKPISLGAPAVGRDDSIVRASVPEIDDGTYAVIWRVTSADGHVVDGAFRFQVGVEASGNGQDLIDQVNNGVQADPAVRWWYGVARFFSVAGAILLIGGGWWLSQCSAELARRRAVRRLMMVAWPALLAGSAAAFGLFGAQAVAGTLGDAVSASVWADVATTNTGRMLLLLVAFACVLGVLLALRRHRREGWWSGAAAAAAVLTLFSFSASGHPNALDPAALWITLDLAHLAAIAAWIGGLFIVTLSGREFLAASDGARLAQRFSLASSIAVPVIIVTGVVQTLKLAGGLDDVTATDWGRLLLVKVTIVAAAAALAGVSRWLLHHDGAASIRRTLAAEAVFGLVAIGLAAGMVALPPTPPISARAFAEQLSANGLIAAVSLSPGRVGVNELHIVITPAGGSIVPVASAIARVELVDQGVPRSPVNLLRDGPNHYSGRVAFPRSGDWTFELVVQITDTESVLLTTTIPIP